MELNAESGFQLLARLNPRSTLLHLDDILFHEGPSPGDIIQISGEAGTGKSLLLIKFVMKTILPKNFEDIEIGGLESYVIFIDTEHNTSIVKLISVMENHINNIQNNQGKEKYKVLENNEMVTKIIESSLKRLIILKTYTSLQFEMNCISIEKILAQNTNISLILIDSLTSFYWSDITNYNSIKKMDLYLKVMIKKFIKYTEEYNIVVIFTIQEYFQSKQSEISSFLINHKIELKKEEKMEKFLACIDSQQCYQYILNENGFICETCGYENKCTELSERIKTAYPEASVTQKHGWPGSFEIYINGVEVHSRLKTLAFPDFENVAEIVKEVGSGMAPKKVEKLQPIFGF